MNPPLMLWRENATGLVHLVEEDQGWLAVYCTWLTVEHEQYRTQATREKYVMLTKNDMPTCLRCIARAMHFGRRLTP